MATVIPGSDYQEVYDNRDIIKGMVQGDSYMIRKTANDGSRDPRAGDNWNKNVLDKMSLASTIWKNKKKCWQDYFNKGKATFVHGDRWTNMELEGSGANIDILTYSLSGYKLAINQLIASINYESGTFFDPECYCIYPVDILGQRFNSLSRFQMEQFRPIHYNYDESHFTMGAKNCTEPVLDPFCSSYSPKDSAMIRLDTPFCIPRFQPYNLFIGTAEIEKMKNVVMHWPLVLKPNQATYMYDCPLTDDTKWVFLPGPSICIGDGSSYQQSVMAYFQNPDIASSLCGLEQCFIQITHSRDATVLTINYRPGDNVWDLMWGDQKLFELSLGFGKMVQKTIFVPPLTDEHLGVPMHDWIHGMDQSKVGRHEHTPLRGKLIGASMTGCNWSTGPCGCGTFDPLVYTYQLSEEIQGDYHASSPQIRIETELPIFNDRGTQSWWPWGSVNVYASPDGEGWGQFGPGMREIVCEDGRVIYCADYSGTTMPINFLQFQFRVTTVWSQCVATVLKQSMGGEKCDTGIGVKDPSNVDPKAVYVLDRLQDSDDFPV